MTIETTNQTTTDSPPKNFFTGLKADLINSSPIERVIYFTVFPWALATIIYLLFSTINFSLYGESELRSKFMVKHLNFIEAGVKDIKEKTGSIPGNIRAFYDPKEFTRPFNNTGNINNTEQNIARIHDLSFPISAGTWVQTTRVNANEVKNGINSNAVGHPIIYTENLSNLFKNQKGFLYLGDGGIYYFIGPFASTDYLLKAFYNKCNGNASQVDIDVKTTSNLPNGSVFSGTQKPSGKCILTGAATSIAPGSELGVSKNSHLTYISPKFITQGNGQNGNYFVGYRVMDRSLVLSI